MENTNQTTSSSEPVVKTMSSIGGVANTSRQLVEPEPINAAPQVSAPLGMPGVNLDPALASRISQQGPINRKKTKLGLIISVLVVIILLGVGGWWFYAYGQTWWYNHDAKWFPQTTWSGYKESGVFKIKVYNIKDNPNLGSMLDVGDAGTSIDQVNMELNYDNQHVAGDMSGKVKYTIDAGQALSMRLGVDFKKIGQDIYLKSDVREIPVPMLAAPLDLGEEWVTFNLQQVKDWIKEINASSTEATDWDQLLTESQQKQAELTKKIEQQRIFNVVDMHESKIVADGTLKKYLYTIKPDKIDTLLNILGETSSVNKMTDAEKKFLTTYFKQGKLSVWINTKTKAIQEYNFEAKQMAINDSKTNGQVDVEITYLVNQADKIEITKPEAIISWPDFGNKIMSQFMSPENYPDFNLGTSSSNSLDNIDTTADADNDSLPDYLEKLYGTDPQNPDTDGDGYKDGEEIQNGYNPLGPGRLETIKM